MALVVLRQELETAEKFAKRLGLKLDKVSKY